MGPWWQCVGSNENKPLSNQASAPEREMTLNLDQFTKSFEPTPHSCVAGAGGNSGEVTNFVRKTSQDMSEDSQSDTSGSPRSTPPVSPREGADSDSALRAHKRENKKALAILGHNPSKSKLKDRLGLSEQDEDDFDAVVASAKTTGSPDLTTDDAADPAGQRTPGGTLRPIAKRRRRKSEPMIDKRTNKKALEVLGVDASRAKVQDLLGFVSDAEEEMARSESLKSVEDAGDISGFVPPTVSTIPASVNKKEVQKALAVLGFDLSKAKAVEMLGIENESINPPLEEIFADHIVCSM